MVQFGDFEWDPEKAAANFKKHKVSFSEALRFFKIPMSSSSPIRSTPRANGAEKQLDT